MSKRKNNIYVNNLINKVNKTNNSQDISIINNPYTEPIDIGNNKVICILGITGVGKSEFCNYISRNTSSNKDLFMSSSRGESCTTKPIIIDCLWRGNVTKPIKVMDTKGMFDTNFSSRECYDDKSINDLEDAMKAVGTLHTIIVAINFTDTRFNPLISDAINKIAQIFDCDDINNNLCFVFTKCSYRDVKDNNKRNDRIKTCTDTIIPFNIITENSRCFFIDSLYDKGEELLIGEDEFYKLNTNMLMDFIWKRKPITLFKPCKICNKLCNMGHIYCKDHKCLVMDCKKSQPCDIHTCSADECNKFRVVRYIYCRDHKCLVKECDKIKDNIIYCTEHKCHDVTDNKECLNIAIDNSKYCTKHKCAKCIDINVENFTLCVTHKCSYHNCNKEANIEAEYIPARRRCMYHVLKPCQAKECVNIVEYDNIHCDPLHRCYYNKCLNIRNTAMLCCNQHQCTYNINNRCTLTMYQGSSYCSDHKCSICPNIVIELGKCCYKHKCGVEQCKQHIYEEYKHCYDHKCKEGKCINVRSGGYDMSKPSDYCDYHKCRKDKCTNLKLYDAKEPSHYCSDHKCKYKGCDNGVDYPATLCCYHNYNIK